MSASQPPAGEAGAAVPRRRCSRPGSSGLALCLAFASFLVLLLAQTSVHRLCACGNAHPRCSLLCTAHEQLQFGEC